MNKIELEWQQLKNHELVGKMFDIISGYTGMMLTVDGWRLTVDSEPSRVNRQPSTRIYYSDANGFDIILYGFGVGADFTNHI